MLRILFGAALLVMCAKADAGFRIAGGECVQYSYLENLFAKGKSDPTGRYNGARAELKKSHIVCMGESIETDGPVLTNGGDIILFASRISITYPIDTRVYVDHSAPDFVQADIPPAYRSVIQAFYEVTSDALRSDGTYSHGPAEKYPEAPHGYTRKGAAVSSPRRCTQTRFDQCKDSEFIPTSLDTGNITVVTNSLELCKNCLASGQNLSTQTSLQALCPVVPIEPARTLFQAASIRPSRGAIALHDCTGSNASKPVCTEAQYLRYTANRTNIIVEESTYLYSPGRIDVVLSGGSARVTIGGVEQSDPIAAIAERSNTSSLSPHSEAFEELDQRDSCITTGRPECCLRRLPDYQAVVGKVSKANVLVAASGDQSFNVQEGLSTVASALERLDRAGMSKDQLVLLLARNGTPTTFSPADQLTSFLWSQNLRATSQMVRMVRDNWPNEPSPIDLRPPVLRGSIDAHAPPSGLNEMQFSRADSLVNKFKPGEASEPIRSYLSALDGVVAVRVADPKNEFGIADAAAARERLTIRVGNALAELQKINLHNFEVASADQLSEMQRSVDSLRSQLLAAEEYAKLKGWVELVKLVGQALKIVRDVYKNLYDAKWNESAKSISDLISSIRDIESAARKLKSPEEIRPLLMAAIERQRLLQAQIAETRQQLIRKEVDLSGEIANDFSRYTQYTVQAKQLSDELLRNILLRYANDGSTGATSQMKLRLTELVNLVERYPQYVPNLSDLAPSEVRCSTAAKSICDTDWDNQPLDCVLLPATGAEYGLITTEDHARLPATLLFKAAGDIASEQPFHRIARRNQVVVPSNACLARNEDKEALPYLQPAFSISQLSNEFGRGVVSNGEYLFVRGRRQGGVITHVYKWDASGVRKTQEIEGYTHLSAGKYVVSTTSPGVLAYELIDDRWTRSGSNSTVPNALAISNSHVLFSRNDKEGRTFHMLDLPSLEQSEQLTLGGPLARCMQMLIGSISGMDESMALTVGCPGLGGAGVIVSGVGGEGPIELSLGDRYSTDMYGGSVKMNDRELVAVAPQRWSEEIDGSVRFSPVVQTYVVEEGAWVPTGRLSIPWEITSSIENPHVGFLLFRITSFSNKYLTLSSPDVTVVYTKSNGQWDPVGQIAVRGPLIHADDRAVYVGGLGGRVDIYTP